MKKLISFFLTVVTAISLFVGCTQEEPPQNTRRSYFEVGVNSRRIKTAAGDYLLAFYGRVSDEEKDKNRIIYLNKYNNIEKEFYIPHEIDPRRDDYRFSENYVMLIDQQYWGVDSHGNPHGFSVIDKSGNIVADYPSRDAVADYENDKFSFENRISLTWWCMKDSNTMILVTPINIYEYCMADGTLTKLISAEDVIDGYSFEKYDKNYHEYIKQNYRFGFSFVAWSESRGLIFALQDRFETTDHNYTLYSLKDGIIKSLTSKYRCERVPYYNPDSDCLIRYVSGDDGYLINEQPHSEYRQPVSFSYNLALISQEKSDDRTDIKYFNSDKMQHYGVSVSARQATRDGIFYNHVFNITGEYLYLADTNTNHISYRLNIITGEGVFVNGRADDYILCPLYRISERYINIENELLTEIKIYKDEILNEE